MNKRILVLAITLFLIAPAAQTPALYQGDYALVVEGPTEIELDATESFSAAAYDPAGNLIQEVAFTRTFSAPGIVTVKRQMTITKPDGTKQVLYGTLDVMVKITVAGGGDTTAEPSLDGVYFTDPKLPSSNVKNATVELINSATSEILIAAYTVESPDVREALIAAAKRLGPGKVKLVVEEKYYSDPNNAAIYSSLRNAGVKIVSDGTKSGSLMHNKFVVVDREMVLSGSTNFTTEQLSNDANNTLIFSDPALAAAYATEFNEMFAGEFDGGKVDNTQHTFTVQMGGGAGQININTASAAELASLPDIGPTTAQKIVSYREANGPFSSIQELDNVSGIGQATISKISSFVTTTGDGSTRNVQVELYFTPSDQVEEQLLNVINNAKKTISFSIFTFTDPDIAAAIQAAKNRGVKVQGVFDAWQANSSYSQYDDLLNAGLDVRKDGFSALNHSKYLVADGATVVTGSYNWTSAADGENDENLLIIKDPGIAAQYAGNFSSTYASAAP